MMLAFHVLLLLLVFVGLSARNNVVVDAFSSAATTSTTTEQQQLREKLMELLPSSGFISNGPAQVQRVCAACTALEENTATVEDFPQALLDGNWRLRFTSASPYGLMLRSLPDEDNTLQQVLDNLLPEAVRKFLIDDSALLPHSIEQRIADSRIVNCVDLTPWPKQGDDSSNPIADALQQALSSVPGPLGQTLEALKEAKINLELDHSFTVPSDPKNTLDVSLEVVRRTLESSGPNLPSFIPKESTYNLPEQLKPTGSLVTTYVDPTLRISRGSSWPFNDEVLVFERVGVPDIMEMPDECVLSFEEDGETPVILCEDDELGEFIPSD